MSDPNDVPLPEADRKDPEPPTDPRQGMTAKEAYNWEWAALPRSAKLITLLIGAPAFAVQVWDAFDDEAVGLTGEVISFALLAAVTLLQIYCLNKTVRDAKRRR